MPSTNRANWIIAGAVLAFAMVVGVIALALIGLDTGGMGFLVGGFMAAVPVPFYLALILWIDRFEPEPPWLLALAFVWGAAIAVFFSLVFNTINSAILSSMAGAAYGQTLGSILSAPVVEELAKGAALLLLFVWKRDEFDNVTDGIVYATMVGLGFAMTENIQYYGRAVAADGFGALGVFFLRGMMSPFCHPLFTSMTGIGLGAARESDRPWVKGLAPVAGLAMAMALHFVWNLSASLGVVFFVTYLIIMVPAFLAVGVIMLLSLRREAKIIRAHLETVVSEGVLSAEDLIIVTSAFKRLGATGRALLDGGFSRWSARRRFHALATDLAFHSWRGTRMEQLGEEVRHAELVEQIRAVRRELALPSEIEPPAPELVARLTREIPLPPSAMTAPGAPMAQLLCTAGPLQGQSFPIGYTGLQIGRDPAAAQIVLRESSVSKRHVWIGYEEGGVVAVDRGSTNGTWLNGARITRAPLTAGDRIDIALRTATFELRMG